MVERKRRRERPTRSLEVAVPMLVFGRRDNNLENERKVLFIGIGFY
jgi:hypothetical protein